MLYTLTAGSLFLLTVANAQTFPDDVQNEIVAGRERLREYISSVILFDIQSSLELAKVYQAATQAVTRWQEATTITTLLTDQFDEIRRVVSSLRGMDASRCTTSSLDQARDAVYDSGAVYENCVYQNVTELRRMIQNLTSLEYTVRTQFVDPALSTINRCALYSRNSAATTRTCITKFLDDFMRAIANAEAILASVEVQINQAVRIVPTCSNRARSNATACVNAIVDSMSVCVEGSGVTHITITKFANYTDGLSDLAVLAVSEFNNLRGIIIDILGTISSVVFNLRILHDQARQITSSYVNNVAQTNLSTAINIVKNAIALRGLPRDQTACVNTANYELRNSLYRAGVAWVQCASRLSVQIYADLQSAERLSTTFNERIKSDGIAAFMKCTQNNANATVISECVQRQVTIFSAYLTSIRQQVQAKSESANSLNGALYRCQSTFETDSGAEANRIINVLVACVPQVAV